MTNISLIVPNTRYSGRHLWSVLPSRGLLSLAAVLKKHGHCVDYVDADMDDLSDTEVIKRIQLFGSTMACITMNTFQAEAGLSLSRAIKRHCSNIITVAGGPHPSALGKTLLLNQSSLDIACVGESEETIIELVRAIENQQYMGDVTGIIFRAGMQVHQTEGRRSIENIDLLPFPAYEIAGNLNRYPGAQPLLAPPSMHVMASRGCPFSCIFCTKSVWGKSVRFRSPLNIVDEVAHLHTAYGIKEIFFQDDTMNINRSWFYAVCDEIINRGLNGKIKFKAPFRVNKHLLDTELLLKAKKAGFWMIFYGVESGNQEVLNRIKKGTTIDEIKRAFRLTHDAGLQTIAAFMVGNIGDTPETILDSVNLAKQIKPSVFGFSIATPLPGTEFYDIAKKQDWIISSDFKEWSQFKAVSRNETMTGEEITALRDWADNEVRGFLKAEGGLRCIPAFPEHDPYWKSTVDYLKQHVRAGDVVVAPAEFSEKLDGAVVPYRAINGNNFTYHWMVVNKGVISDIPLQVLKLAQEKCRAVFANEVFVIFSSDRTYPEIAKNLPHYSSFEENVRVYEKGASCMQKSDEPWTDRDYSSLNVEEIREAMNKRYSNEQAYSIGCLWDKVRADELNRRTVEMVGPAAESRILEIGCGIGGTARHFDNAKEFIGTDLSEEAVAQASREFSNMAHIRFSTMNAMALDFEDNAFDIVIAKEVIEHVPDPERALREAFRVLRPEGKLLLTSPNRDSLHLRINRMLGHSDFKCSFDHIREFTFDEAVTMLENEGFVLKRSEGVFVQPYWGIPGIDDHLRHLTDNDPEMVEMLRKLGEASGAEFAFCFVILAVKPGVGSADRNSERFLKRNTTTDKRAVSSITKEQMIALNYDHHRRMQEQAAIHAKENVNEKISHNDNIAYERLLGHIPSSGKCLELGAAYGGAFELLGRKFKDVAGVEIYEPAAKAAQQNGLNIVLSNLEHLPFDQEFFEAVVSRHVMEHTYDVDRAIGEIRRVLVNEGYSAAITPHYFPDPEAAHITQLRQEEWEDVYRRHEFTIIHSSVALFNCEECHIVARKVERNQEIERLIRTVEETRLSSTYVEDEVMELAYLYFYGREYEKALTIFRYVMNVNPSNVKALNNAGVIYWGLGLREDALRHFKEAYKVSPYDYSLLRNLIAITADIGDLELADTLISSFLEKHKGFEDRLIKFCSDLQNRQEHEKARRVLERMLLHSPDMKEAERLLGTAGV